MVSNWQEAAEGPLSLPPVTRLYAPSLNCGPWLSALARRTSRTVTRHRNRGVNPDSFKGYSKELELEIPVLGDLLFTAHAAARSPARAGAGFPRNSLVRRAGNGKHRQKLLDLGAWAMLAQDFYAWHVRNLLESGAAVPAL